MYDYGISLVAMIQISLCVYSHRALEIAVKHKTHVDTVLAFREVYLKQIGCTETLQHFQQYSGKVCAFCNLYDSLSSNFPTLADY